MAEDRSNVGEAGNKGTGTGSSGVERPVNNDSSVATSSPAGESSPIIATKKAIGDNTTDKISSEDRLSRLARELSARREAESMLREVTLGRQEATESSSTTTSTASATAAATAVAVGSGTSAGDDVAWASSYTERLRRALASPGQDAAGEDAAGEDTAGAGAEAGGRSPEGHDVADRVATIISELKRDGYFDLSNDDGAGGGGHARRASVDVPRTLRGLYAGAGGAGMGFGRGTTGAGGRGLQRQHSDGKLPRLSRRLPRYHVSQDDLRVVKMLNVVTSSFEERLEVAVSERVQVQAELDGVLMRHEAERESWSSEMDALRAERDALQEELEAVRRDNARKDEETSRLMSQMTVEMSTLLRKKDEEVEGGGNPMQSLSARSLRRLETEERTMREFQRWQDYIKEKFEEGRRSSNSKLGDSSDATNSGDKNDGGRGKQDTGSPDRLPLLSNPSRRKHQRRTSSAA